METIQEVSDPTGENKRSRQADEWACFFGEKVEIEQDGERNGGIGNSDREIAE
jgi:hypothetical protein